MMESKLVGHIEAFFTLLIWGTTFLMSKTLMSSFTASQILLIRFVIAYFVLSLISLLKNDFHIVLKDELLFFLAGCLGLSLEALCEIFSMRYTSTANTSVIVSTNPFFIGLASILFLKNNKKPKWNFFVGFVIALAGATVISFNGATKFGLNPLGDLIAFGSAITWAAYTVLITKLSERNYSTLYITRRVYFWGVISMILSVFLEKEPFDYPSLFTVPNLPYLLFLGIFASALGFIFWNSATKLISPVSAGVYLYLTPVITVIAGALFLKEQINIVSIVGIATVIVGTWLSSLEK